MSRPKTLVEGATCNTLRVVERLPNDSRNLVKVLTKCGACGATQEDIFAMFRHGTAHCRTCLGGRHQPRALKTSKQDRHKPDLAWLLVGHSTVVEAAAPTPEQALLRHLDLLAVGTRAFKVTRGDLRQVPIYTLEPVDIRTLLLVAQDSTGAWIEDPDSVPVADIGYERPEGLYLTASVKHLPLSDPALKSERPPYMSNFFDNLKSRNLARGACVTASKDASVFFVKYTAS